MNQITTIIVLENELSFLIQLYNPTEYHVFSDLFCYKSSKVQVKQVA